MEELAQAVGQLEGGLVKGPVIRLPFRWTSGRDQIMMNFERRF
jgi:hypothetical protein